VAAQFIVVAQFIVIGALLIEKIEIIQKGVMECNLTMRKKFLSLS
jgi:hypothetical protein